MIVDNSYGYIEPSKGKLLSFIMQGVDLSQYVHCVRTYESVCKSYLTAQVVIYDTNNLIENMNITAGVRGDCSFTSPPSPVTYNWVLYVLKLKGEQVPDTLRYQIYYIDFIGQVYYQDKSQTVQYGSTNQTGSDLISAIWGQYLSDGLNIITPSAGMMGTPEKPYNVPIEAPLTAIQGIMKKMVSAQSADTGNWLLWRDNSQVNLAQLETLLTNGGTTEHYIQKETWLHAMAPQIYW